MIAIPLTKRISWGNPPFLTITLIIINLFIFAVFQSNDDERWHEAIGFYVKSGLSELERGFYQRYLAERQTEEAAVIKKEPTKPNPQQDEKYYRKVIADASFLAKLGSGRIVEENSPDFLKWRALREQFDAKLNKVVSVRYGFRPAYPRAITWLSHMFLHGGWGHVIGNMVFLWIIGCLIEYGCRHLWFLALYLLGGICATSLFWALNMNSTIPLVGASGAISGIMGAFTVFYGLKKVVIFLNLGFYFNNFRFPAVVLLPFWLGNELFQLIFDKLSPVAYAAHFGGLAGGALLAWGAKQVPGLIDFEAFESAEEEERSVKTLETALEHMRKLEFDRARELLRQLLAETPDDLEAWQHLYSIERQNPQCPNYHHAAQKLLDLLCRQPDTFPKACTLFKGYLQVAHPPRLPAELYLQVSNALCETGQLHDACKLLLALLKHSSRLPTLPTALLKLAGHFQRQGDEMGCRQCAQTLAAHYPEALETRLAAEKCKGRQGP
jgi:membrane associated rhomboid family serine protease